MILKVKRLDPTLPIPEYKTPGAVALDLYSRQMFYVCRFQTLRVMTGLAIEIPPGYEGTIRPRSGFSGEGRLVHFGTVDQDFSGELGINVTNLRDDIWEIKHGDRIAQLVISPVYRVELVEADILAQTGRGGFGSTGKR